MPKQPAVTYILDPDAQPVVDFRVTNHGTIWTFTPLTLAAADWWSDNVQNELPTWGGGHPVDHRMVEPILFALAEQEFRI